MEEMKEGKREGREEERKEEKKEGGNEGRERKEGRKEKRKQRRCLWSNKDPANVSSVFLVCEEIAYQSLPTKIQSNSRKKAGMKHILQMLLSIIQKQEGH